MAHTRSATRRARVIGCRTAGLAYLASLACACGPSRAVGLDAGASFDDDADVEAPTDAVASPIDGGLEGGADGALATATLSPLLARWPLVSVGAESRGVSSFDRGGGNDDGFSGTYSELYAETNGEHVIFDAAGPGRLNTLWFTSAVSGTSPLGLGRVRFYFDAEANPRAAVDADALFAGGAVGFPASLVFDNARSTGGFVSWVPLTFAGRLKVTTQQRPAFYSAQWDALRSDQTTTSWKPTDAPDAWARALMAPAPENPDDGDEVALDWSHEGAALITNLTFRPHGAPTPAALRAARLRITWEDEAAPAVDCPVDAFFGSGLGEAPVRSVAFTMSPGRWQNHLPMPFWRRARVQVTGVAGRLYVRLVANPYDEARAAHLRVVWRQERPTTPGEDFEALRYGGAGRLVATVLTIEPPNAATDKGWWEGDLRSYADGRRTPGVHGTGHEDDHFGGWSNEFFSGPFSLPMHGEPRADLHDHNGQYNGDVTMYRVWTGIPFLGEVLHSFEHGTENNRSVNESAATFFYGESRPWIVPSDALDVCDTASRDAHHLLVQGETMLGPLKSAFEGRAYRTQVTMCHHAHTGAATFQLAAAPGNDGLWLRRVFDQSVGRQSAVVRVGGRAVGTWSIAEKNATARWAERDFFIPPGFVGAAALLTVSIEPTGSAPWDAAGYRAISIVPPAPRH
jgi:hypothetical protein